MANDQFQAIPPRGTSVPGPVAAAEEHPAESLLPAKGLAGRFKALRRWLSSPEGEKARDNNTVREVVETIVFVVVLVLLLKTFAAEAFVIPTGSMATTLWGYQKYVECPQCHYQFPVNCSEQAEGKVRHEISGCICPNCRYQIDFERDGISPSCNTGDRVLVAKSLYDLGLANPGRLDVVVFKYPEAPQTDHVPMNYIKRLIGLPGETIGIYYGKLYQLPAGLGPKYNDSQLKEPLIEDQDVGLTQALGHWKGPDGQYGNWMRQQMMHEQQGRDLIEKNKGFKIIRKPPEHLLAMRRLVYDNDHQAEDLAGKFPRRWQTEGAWKDGEGNRFHHDATAANGTDWLRYRHLLRDGAVDAEGNPKPELITDFIGYNTKETDVRDERDQRVRQPAFLPQNWVGDLMLECEVTIDQPEGELVLELSKGVDRFRAHWDLSSGQCSLIRVSNGKEGQPLDSKPTALKKKGTYLVRFGNVDERLVVWVGRSLPFGNGVEYDAPGERGPQDNDLQPASIGVKGGAVSVQHLQLWRDTYYTLKPGEADSSALGRVSPQEMHDLLSDPSKWDPLRELDAKTLYVQPNHYLCLGDNSPESSDGRSWGLVPKRLLLGRALVVYYPFYFPMWPLNSPDNRVGTIK